jgi:hypothetical protein
LSLACSDGKRITVTSPQVSMTLKAAGLRRGRRRRKVAAVVRSGSVGNGHALNVDELVQVKRLADQLGGTEKLKKVLDALEKLM